MKEYILKRPMLLCAVIALFTSAIGYGFKLFLILAAIVISVSLGFFIYKSNIKATTVNIMLVLLLLSQFNAYTDFNKLSAFAENKTTASFVVYNLETNRSGLTFADIQVTDSDLLEKGTRVSVIYSGSELELGDNATAVLYLKALDKDYKTLTLSKNIYLRANMYECEINSENKDFVLSRVGKIRNYIKTTLYKYMESEAVSTVNALLLGDDSGFSSVFKIAIRRSGVSHIMVVSGMHLAIFVSILLYLINKFFYNRFAKALVMLTAILIVSALCGFTMSILRAGFMYLLLSLGLCLGRDTNSENILGAAVSVILIFSPFAFLSVGFLLSVLSTFGILSVAIPITKYLNENSNSKLLLSVASLLLITFSATLLTLPVIIWFYGEVSTVSLITNLLITSLVTPVFWLALSGLVLNLLFPFLANLVFSVCEELVLFINNIISVFGTLKFSTVNTPKIYAYLSVLVIFDVFYLLLACKRRKDMLKLKEINENIIKEGGGRLKWQ